VSYDNSGSFSANKRKEKDTHPDIKGKATINGVEYWIDGWKKTNDNGIWYSLSFKPKDAPATQPEPAPQRGGGKPALDDGSDIPF
jgi:hypothetical protein